MSGIRVDDIVDILENQLFILTDGADHDLVESGDFDSLRFVELLLAVERLTGAQVAPRDLDLDDLRTPRRMAEAFDAAIRAAEAD